MSLPSCFVIESDLLDFSAFLDSINPKFSFFRFSGPISVFSSLGAVGGVRVKPSSWKKNPVFLGPGAFSESLHDPTPPGSSDDDSDHVRERPVYGGYNRGGSRYRIYYEESGNEGDDEDEEMPSQSPERESVPRISPPPFRRVTRSFARGMFFSVLFHKFTVIFPF